MSSKQLAHTLDTEDVPPLWEAIALLQAHLAFVYDEVGEVRARVAALDGRAPDALVVRARAVLANAVEALDLLDFLYDSGLLDDVPAGRCERDGRAADLVFIARMGLREHTGTFAALGLGATEVERLSTIDGAMHAVQKSVSAVERCMAVSARLPASTDFYAQNETGSLEIRRQYVGLRAVVLRDGAPPPALVAQRLRSVSDAIAQILGRASALHMRAPDRAVLLLCHARIGDYLSGAAADGHGVAGRRLWQDIMNGAAMFLDVNKREELVLHDGRVVEAAMAQLDLAALGGPAAMPDVAAQLSSIQGRSPELDALVAQPPDQIDRDELRALLESIATSLGRGAGRSSGDQTSALHVLPIL